MKKILLLADTHIRTSGKLFPEVLLTEMEKADLILHAGDFIESSVVEDLMKFAPVEAVYGNVDSEELQEKLPDKKVVEIEGFRIGLVHGHLGKGKSTPERALRSFEGEAVDVIVFGHSHIPHHEEVDGITLYNPGSATAKRFQKNYSYGWLTIHDSLQIETHYF
ncbi:metallophosphoesterase family protein [Pseudalkalibacillus sp. SCS-8]|uniref:metallophosphoesterase family protein n=1 Tax=Pseudalkalibacillus nanhaiensis TaxID=3115291 RepID=UPI0032D9CAF3